ncbi:acyl carrier protein [uncultured Piscinibacter sp.]|uniref:acyl carrier protein n=1 Tax=uncultured Piscinibacter sp. TaxID=1131835 RepID=UPI002623B3E1|nr:acyl carrier protein [uncultured Piscinibacter sp.]
MSTIKTEDALHWIAEVFEESPGRIGKDTPRNDIPGWDSLGTLSLIAALDERFDIHLAEDAIEGLQSVADLLDVLRQRGALQDA